MRPLPDSALEAEMETLGVAPKQKAKARQGFQRSAEQAKRFGRGRDRLVLPGGISLDSTPSREAKISTDGCSFNRPTGVRSQSGIRGSIRFVSRTGRGMVARFTSAMAAIRPTAFRPALQRQGGMKLRHADALAIAAWSLLIGWYLLVLPILSGCSDLQKGGMVTCQAETAGCQSGPEPIGKPSPAPTSAAP